MTHLSTNEITRYCQKRLPPTDLLVVDQHLAACDACRVQLQAMGTAPQFSLDWQEPAAWIAEHLTYEQLEAYAERRGDAVEREIVAGHVAVCGLCAQELHDLQSLVKGLARPVAPWWQGWRERWAALLQIPRYQLVGAIATMLLLMVFVPWQIWHESRDLAQQSSLRESGGAAALSVARLLDVWNYQARLASKQDIRTLLRHHATMDDTAAAFGFAARSDVTRFYLLGVRYAASLAHLRGGNVDIVAQHWQVLEQESLALQAPAALVDSIWPARQRLASPSPIMSQLGDDMAGFQRQCEAFARQRGETQLVLFQAGAWLVNLRLTAAARQRDLLRQGAVVRYFSTALHGQNAPRGVFEAFDQLLRLLEKPDMTDADMQKVLALVVEIQAILG
jgi:hypothetical protein